MKHQFWRKPPCHSHRLAVEELFKERYPSLKVFPIGKSVLGRDITAFSIGNPAGATVFFGATHGGEWITTLLLWRFCEEVLEGLSTGRPVSEIDLRRALTSRSLVLVPCLNPDGVDIQLEGWQAAGTRAEFVRSLGGGNVLWQANANGVDLNHNFKAGWPRLKALEQENGIISPAPTRYGGAHPHSEPETCAAVEFCLRYQPRSLYSLHAQGEEIYYRYGDATPERSRLMAQILAASSGYRIEAPRGLAADGGLKDWFIQRLRRPGFTIEVGKGNNPLPLSQLDPIYCRIQEMLILATLL